MARINIGILGVGRWGPNIIRNYYGNRESFLVGIADPDEKRLKFLENRYEGVRLTTCSDELINNPKIDALIITTPPHTHFELAKKALNAGKHIFVEKPLSPTPDECAELVSLAAKKERLLFVGHVFVYNSGIQAAKKYIDRKELGDIYYLQINRTNLGPVRTEVSALWDLAPHDISIIDYWFGQLPVSVSAVGGRFLSDKLEDAVFATYKMADGAMVNLHVSWLSPKKVREIVIVGDKKMLVWDDMNLTYPITVFDKRVDHEPDDSVHGDSIFSFHSTIHEGDTIIPKLNLSEPLQAECQAFLKAIHDPKTSLSTGKHAWRISKVLEATDQSLNQEGRIVPINLEKTW